MDFITIVAVAVGLSFDTFAVSLSLGVVKNKILFRQAVPVAMILAVFQAGLLVTGYFLGSLISDFMKAADHWVALILLTFLGVRMITEGLKTKGSEEVRDYSKFLTILTLAVGTSIDAFAVGISFALLKIKIWYPAVIIGTVTFLASMIAIRIGKSAGNRLGGKAEIIGGIILVLIGIKIFLEHMVAA
jgi:putative Mn2+ efflux pump MntP